MGSFSATFSNENITFYMKISPGDMIANIPLVYGKKYSDSVQSIPIYYEGLYSALSRFMIQSYFSPSCST